MAQSFRDDVELTQADLGLLAVAELLQPTDASEIHTFCKGTILGEALSEGELESHFRRLEREGYFWRTGLDKFVVTPRGEELARRVSNHRRRDKLRLLILNKNRHKK
jgi:hypothetical protein